MCGLSQELGSGTSIIPQLDQHEIDTAAETMIVGLVSLAIRRPNPQSLTFPSEVLCVRILLNHVPILIVEYIFRLTRQLRCKIQDLSDTRRNREFSRLAIRLASGVLGVIYALEGMRLDVIITDLLRVNVDRIRSDVLLAQSLWLTGT